MRIEALLESVEQSGEPASKPRSAMRFTAATCSGSTLGESSSLLSPEEE